MTQAHARSVKADHGSVKAQFSTFLVADRLYGIDVTKVQEVVKPMTMTIIPLAPNHIRGLINLRGQVATAIGMRELFGLPSEQMRLSMNVVCKCEGSLVSLLVDEIGDVVEVSQDAFEPPPQTVPAAMRRFMNGVYKIDGPLLTIVDVDQIARFL